MYRPVFKFVSFDAQKYIFAKLFAMRALHVKDLSRFHEGVIARKRENGESSELTYEDNLAARELLNRSAAESWFWPLHRAFVANVIAPLFNHRVAYTWPPTFRVHMAGSPSVSDWHRDVEVTGRDELITVWMPFVDTFDTNSIWVETEYGNQNYAPIDVRHGQALLFDSGYLSHGSVSNTTNVTRVSMDFRVSPKDLNPDQRDLGILRARPPGMKVELNPEYSKTKSDTLPY